MSRRHGGHGLPPYILFPFFNRHFFFDLHVLCSRGPASPEHFSPFAIDSLRLSAVVYSLLDSHCIRRLMESVPICLLPPPPPPSSGLVFPVVQLSLPRPPSITVYRSQNHSVIPSLTVCLCPRCASPFCLPKCSLLATASPTGRDEEALT